MSLLSEISFSHEAQNLGKYKVLWTTHCILSKLKT